MSDGERGVIGRGRKGTIRCLRMLGFQIAISLAALGCLRAISPLEMARRPLHEPIRAILVLLRVKGWLSGTAVVRFEKSSSIW